MNDYLSGSSADTIGPREQFLRALLAAEEERDRDLAEGCDPAAFVGPPVRLATVADWAALVRSLVPVPADTRAARVCRDDKLTRTDSFGYEVLNDAGRAALARADLARGAAAGVPAGARQTGRPKKSAPRVNDALLAILRENPHEVGKPVSWWVDQVCRRIGRRVTKEAVEKTKTWRTLIGPARREARADSVPRGRQKVRPRQKPLKRTDPAAG